VKKMQLSSDLGVWIAAILSVAYLSASYKDSILSRLAFETTVGAGIGHYLLSALVTVQDGIIEPAISGDLVAITMVVLGVMLLMRLWPKYSWISRYPSSVFFGVGAGVTVASGVSAMILGQITGTILDFPSLVSQPTQFIGSIFLVVGILCILSYFIFTVKRGGLLRYPQHFGKLLLMYLFASYTNLWTIGGMQLVAEQIIFDTLGWGK
jgi:hypothetical protein